ncbi:hypothetical protein GCM10009721_26910 [Terrabacter tumescens]|uniref:Tyr recombinase domain-containing protein n=1 Tax=Terrabacter tumescens TaxID=60443 RepID=A0ABQ2I4I1_9MICO|nr:hypothetical protein [Terrabacter tumescens]GGM98641.1 hypothetical protein GCM10009721_26910 [Terrabacter tumescens]
MHGRPGRQLIRWHGSATPSHVRRWWVSLDEHTPTIDARAYALLKAILNTAVADENLIVNPCRIRSASNAPRARDIRPATIEEPRIIVDALPENRRATALLCSWCAMRIGEVLELRRKDVELERGVVRVERGQRWTTRIELANAMFDDVEIWHNRQRRHSSARFTTPAAWSARAFDAPG